MQLVNKLLPKTILFLCLFIVAITVLWLPMQADEGPTAVDLIYFNAVPLNNAVRLDWETASELNTLGYRIKRAEPGGTEMYLDYVGENGFIPGIGGVAVGGFYTVTDDDDDNPVQNGEVYTYILIEVEDSGNEREESRRTVTVGIPPTNTPVVISVPGNNSSTATATPTASTGATATPTTQSESQKPTNTPPSFVTITPNSTQPTTTPAPNSNTTHQSGDSSTSSSANTSSSVETNSVSLGGVTVVSAQEETTEETELMAQSSMALAPQTQDGYPGAEPTATAVSNSPETYPDNPLVNSQDEPVPVIGSSTGAADTQADEPTDISASGNATTQGRAFLWMGFIVALLIFTTGLIGSILLFTRKTN